VDEKDLLVEMLEAQNDTAGDDGFVSAFLTVKKPARLDYKIDAFIGEKKYANEDDEVNAFNKKMKIYDGVSSTFEFECLGRVQVVDREFDVELNINNLGMVEYIKEGRTGRIGDGWYESGHFLFRLSLPPNAVKDIIDKVTFYDRMFTDEQSAGLMSDMMTPMYGDKIQGEGDAIKIRLDLKIRKELATWGDRDKITYAIERLYI
jgi:hypothetical protein